MPIDPEKEQKQKLLALVREAIARDDALREQYQVGEKFRFIRERLHGLLERLEKLALVEELAEKKRVTEMASDEMPVFVYLYNAHGLTFKSWQNMLSQKVFYEYSVNRPIYSQQLHIEELLRGKANKLQHGYLVFFVKKTDILSPVTETSPKDALGNPMIKIREGSLRTDKFVVFVHNLHEYILDAEGLLIRKS